MSFLCEPNKSWLFDVGRNRLLAGIMKQVVYTQFCAGESGREVRATLERFKKMGFRGTIITYAKETVFDYNKNLVHDAGIDAFAHRAANQCPNIDRWRSGVLETIDMLGHGDQLAVKYARC
jgi:hypothetical protein